MKTAILKIKEIIKKKRNLKYSSTNNAFIIEFKSYSD